MADMFMPSPLPAVNATQMGGMMPFISPDQVAQNQTDMLAWQQKQALAQQLMQSQYIPNTGGKGVAGNVLERVMGMLANNQNNQKLSDILKQQFAIENQASQAKRQQEIEDEYRKMGIAIQQATGIARGEGQVKNELNPIEAVGGGKFILDHRTGELKINPDFNASEIDLEKAKAAIAAANRQGPADPFREIKTAIAQGVITPEEGQKRMHDVALGLKEGGGNVPSGYRATPTGNLEAIPGGPADPATQMNKPQPVSAENRTKLGLLDAAQSALDNYKAQGTDKQGVPHPMANTFTPGNTANTSMDEAVANMLRVESGAAISAGEIAAAKDRYTPSALRSDAENKNRLEMLDRKLKQMRASITAGTNEAQPGAVTPKAGAQPTQTIINPQTGERKGLVNGEWVTL